MHFFLIVNGFAKQMRVANVESGRQTKSNNKVVLNEVVTKEEEEETVSHLK